MRNPLGGSRVPPRLPSVCLLRCRSRGRPLNWVGHAQPPQGGAPRSGQRRRSSSPPTPRRPSTAGCAPRRRARDSNGFRSPTRPAAAPAAEHHSGCAGWPCWPSSRRPGSSFSGRGKYGKNVSRTVDYVTARAGPTPGFLTSNLEWWGRTAQVEQIPAQCHVQPRVRQPVPRRSVRGA